jgi:plasmid stability protein
MADLEVRQLDDDVADALRARAGRRGISLEEEVRSTLTASADRTLLALARSRGVGVIAVPSAERRVQTVDPTR